MRILTELDLFATRFVARASPNLYNRARTLRIAIDLASIKISSRQGHPFVFVYQQGRVGSTSVYESLRLADLPHQVFHVHTLSRQRALREIARARKCNGRVSRNLYIGKYLADEMQNPNASAKPWYVVSLIRDPIAVAISLQFMNPEMAMRITEDCSERNKEKILAFFQDLFERDDPRHWGICNWHENVFLKELGVDVFKFPFDQDRGYSVIEKDPFRILIMRFEDLSTNFTAGCSALFKKDGSCFQLRHSNIHRNRQFDDAHTFVKNHLKLSRDACEKVYSTRAIEHFYSPGCIERLIQKWTRPS